MEITAALSFALVAGLVMTSPGPKWVLIAKTVPTSGKNAGFANLGGYIASLYIHGLLSAFGLSVILVQSAQAFFIVKMLGAAYLIWIGTKALWSAKDTSSASNDIQPAKNRRGLRRAFQEGFLTSLLSPKVSLFYLAVFPQFIDQKEDAVSAAFILLTIHAVLNLIWFSTMIILLSRLTIVAQGSGFQRWLKVITGIVFIGFGIKLAALTRAGT